MKRVSYIFPVSHRFRLPFHELLRGRLADEGIDYRVIYSEAPLANRQKGDTVEIPWGTKVGLVRLWRTNIVMQWALGQLLASDLVIVQQENRLLFNYICNVVSMLGLKRVAYFGHGRNFQARNPHSWSERWKRWWATRCEWWFGYTEETRRHIEALGFPAERITVFNNAVDTTTLRRQADTITPEQLAARREALALKGDAIAVFVGGLYPDKRLDFLIEAAVHVRAAVPDFELVVVGGGPDYATLRGLAAPHDWIRVTGPLFGADKVEIMRLGKLFLMPGLVGLAVLDAGVLGLPVVTTAFPHHSPEIAYLEDGATGAIVAEWRSSAAYAQAVIGLLRDEPRRAAMAAAGRAAAAVYTVEAMAERFADGVRQALNREIR